ncbi:MAG: 23S rRNA (adenine(2503)-C(2))-methyltransferase RlmN [Neisseriales bacterium]|nr:MAG: 23S rRNA (adenine(2503)-C(2))-methyltransferase RlmN [Neisseriales bacterium]
MKINLLNFTLPKLEEYFLSIDEKKFRARQVFRWMHIYGAETFAEMTDLAKSLRAKLEEIATIEVPKLVTEGVSSDGTRKWALEVGNGNKIEAVFIPEDDRGTLCVSSQVGCALECQFCSTARQGFNRNLTPGEIVGQLWWANKRLGRDPKGEKLITNVVMMGMGEPLANYDNVIDAMKIILDDNAYNLSKRKLTLSTSGMIPGLDRLGDDCPVSLAISLHASNDVVRDQIIPLNKKYPIAELLEACKRYLQKSPKDYVTFEYVMLKDVNDNLEHAIELSSLVKGIECKFNLIPFNPFPNSGFESSSMNQIVRFQRILQNAGYITTVRKTRGDDIDAACGQLVGKVNDKTKRQEKWKNFIPLQEV